MKFSQLASVLGGTLIGSGDFEVTELAPIDLATPASVTFVLEGQFEKKVAESPALGFICFKALNTDKPVIVVPHPRAAFAQAVAAIYPERIPQWAPGISDRAAIDPSAKLGRDVTVHAGAVIGAGCVIGDEVKILANAVLGRAVLVGDRTVIHPLVSLYDRVQVGSDSIINSGTIVGSDGYGFFPDGMKWGKIPQVGTVIIGDNVEIGANNTIDRGALGNTVIGNGTKIDNQTHIAHNCRIGENCAITSQICFAGGVVLGNHVMVGGHTALNQHISIADNVVIMGNTGVTKSITEPGVMVSGYPAKPHLEQRREYATMQKLIDREKQTIADRRQNKENTEL